MRRICFAVLVIIIGCQSVKEKDWYEHKGTKERIQILSIDNGKLLSKVGNDFINEQNKIGWEVYKIKNMHRLAYEPADSLSECVSFITTNNVRGYLFIKFNIVNVNNLKSNYKLIE